MKAKEQLFLQARRLEAVDILHSRGRWLSLVLYAILTVFLIILPFAISVNIIGIFSVTALWFYGPVGETVLLYLLMIPILFFLTCPGIVFVMRGVVAVVMGRSSRNVKVRYWRDLWLGFLILSRTLVPPLLVFGTWCSIREKFVEERLIGFFLGGIAALGMAVLMILWLTLTKKCFFVAYLSTFEHTPRAICYGSCKLLEAQPRFPVVYLFSFIGALVLSVLTLGVLFVIWVLPLMWTTYVRAAHTLLIEHPVWDEMNE